MSLRLGQRATGGGESGGRGGEEGCCRYRLSAPALWHPSRGHPCAARMQTQLNTLRLQSSIFLATSCWNQPGPLCPLMAVMSVAGHWPVPLHMRQPSTSNSQLPLTAPGSHSPVRPWRRGRQLELGPFFWYTEQRENEGGCRPRSWGVPGAAFCTPLRPSAPTDKKPCQAVHNVRPSGWLSKDCDSTWRSGGAGGGLNRWRGARR